LPSHLTINKQQQWQQQCGPFQFAHDLLSSWTEACTAGAGAAQAAGAALPWSDLACAVLQQPQLLLGCSPQQLVQLCVASTQPVPSASSSSLYPDEPSAVSQLLDCSNGVCAASLEVVNLSMRHRFQQQQQQVAALGVAQGHELHELQGLSWLASRWLQDLADKQTVGVPHLEVAKKLLAAATSVDQQLKQVALGNRA
jgi:hypothetical protein